MNITDIEILLLLGYSVLLGAALALCYVAFSFVRLLISPIAPDSAKGRALCDTVYFIVDVVYSLFAGICTSLMFFALNHGKVRLAGLLGSGIGFCICHFTLGRWLIKQFSRCVSAVRKGIKFIYGHTLGRLFGMLKKIVKSVLLKPLVSAKKRRSSKRAKRKVKDEKLEFFG